jgi:hypothetical protein
MVQALRGDLLGQVASYAPEFGEGKFWELRVQDPA